MENFITASLDWLSEAFKSLLNVMNWLIEPLPILNTIGMGDIPPLAILTFGAFIFVLVASLIHLVNPLG